ncbi:MAG: Maf family protein [Porticoccaceae bacterium]|jgi:septum formation protein|tara:strand:- start:5739 stop:6326 length:588 start_codon:yes stop_codon:yes gene_type:complete
MSNLILASSSSYRKSLLQRLNIEFSCSSPDVDESALAGEPATALAERLALVKAQTVASQFPNTVVVGADQVAELNGTILGKPGNHQQAVKQLTAQAGKRVLFHSGLAIVRIQADGEMQQHSLINTTEVTFRPLSQKQIEQYLLTEQPYDCAGSFKAEGLGISLFTAINSNDPTSLIGLPLIDLCSALPQFSINII